ncbi:mechanosensitive ion channel family protein [Glutamicibacter sp. PS]|uniref:mechanosensitive ion channel family protein n=1 Tax=Glutamicibacter sp. PS TaxID=3075634 RepID=UPI0028474FC7|nr:mechanosensitive ion channel family protein [Glutamicibacter sp. PS]MDR4531915.1 mechanosensitive ion channel family protein [Glutamicibacter sp. PS]
MQPSPTAPVDQTVEDVIQASSFLPVSLQFWVLTASGIAIAFLLTLVLSRIASRILRRYEGAAADVKSSRIPFFGTLSSVSLKIMLVAFQQHQPWYDAAQFVLLILMVSFLTWFIIRVVRIVEDVVLGQFAARFGPGRRMAKVQTQVGLLRRVLVAVLCVLAVAAVLLTIDQVRTLGAGILASAGLASVVLGLAVQSSLANLFAGLQIAFTDSVRVDDVVVVEQERGNVEEITLTYVVVKLLDGRRMILPSTYFTTTPFENWSRTTSEIDGTVVLQLKWNAPVAQLRERTTELLEASDLWDGRTNSLLVTDAVGGLQTVTIYVSARNAGDLWELRTMLREKLLAELLESQPDCLPDPKLLPGV